MENLFHYGILIFITTLLLYIAINTYFHYHVSVNRIYFLATIAFVLILLTYVNTPLSAELLWLLIILFLLTWFGNYFSKVKKIDGFVLLNVTKKDYYFVNRFLNEQVDNSLINKTSICYSIKKPYLLVFKGEDSKVIKKIIASLDKQMQTRPKQLKMIQYAAVIVSLLLLAILWRF